MDKAIDHLRPLLQGVNSNLPGPIRDLGVSLLGRDCYQVLLVDVDPVWAPHCARLAVSKALGLGIVAASAVVKVPQIAKLARSGSPAGVSVLAYMLETASYLISLAYNVRSAFPFTTYGETALIAAQNVVIAVMVLRLAGRTGAAAAFVAAVAVAASALLAEPVVDMRTLAMLQAGAGVLGAASKVPQIVAIWREGGTGQLSAFAVFNYLVGSLTRIFTTLQEVDDKLILYGFVSGFVLNAVIAFQMVYYWNSPTPKVGRGAGQKKDKVKKAVEVPVSSAPSWSSSSGAAPSRVSAPTTRRRG